MTACYEMLLYGREALLGRQAHRATPGVWSALPSTSARDTMHRAMSDGKRSGARIGRPTRLTLDQKSPGSSPVGATKSESSG